MALDDSVFPFKLDFGVDTTILYLGECDPGKIKFKVVDTDYSISDNLEEKIETAWKENLKKNPHAYDAEKWRYEGYRKTSEGGLEIMVSRSSYSVHNVMRHEDLGSHPDAYPNPITINTIQETTDGYILIGVRGGISDQQGLAVVGAGMIETGEDGNPEDPFNRMYEECEQETIYKTNREPFDKRKAKALAIVFGSNRDSTITFYQPLNVSSEEVDINDKEYSGIIMIKNDPESLQKFLIAEGANGIKAADHALGSVWAYMLYKYAHDIYFEGEAANDEYYDNKATA